MIKLLQRINALPMRWKLAVWFSSLIIVLFVVYNGAQYFVLDRWALGQEEQQLLKSADEMEGYFASGKKLDDPESKRFLEKVNDSYQFIRILDEKGTPLLTISEGLPPEWVPPETSVKREVMSEWHEEDHLLVLRSPFRARNARGTIEIVRNLENYERLGHVLFAVMACGGLFGIAMGAAASILMAGQFTKPISRLARTMENIKQHGLSERVEISDTRNEMSMLGQVFNEMMDRLETSFRQQKQFVEDASHELRTPIAIIEGHLALLKRWGKKDASVLDESLDASLQELSRLKGLTQELLALTKAESLPVSRSFAPFGPSPCIGKIVDDFRVIHPDFLFESDIRIDSGDKLAVSEDHFKQILLIILDNAVKYSGESRVVRVNCFAEGQDRIALEVADYGIGIPKSEIPRVFDRFYRVDKARTRFRGGSGLGLSIAKRIVDSYGGNISIISKENKGTIVTVSFPRPQQEKENHT
ncbi:HAMP domain-containing protein [Cohnella sp. CFH 77786]|uniref:HAMP domain-containing sensor histidine kinase n=1 Tax=Cohnella sp. CFH 77786 TaxID=2662265 RepID=UPI001C608368|nr:HAMP domain-containing histidine kinase [Cohnella sp. CFH 77786]MBW5446012.1 HAMP domain-containing protein [Cohnella sp. CFH 77786]